MNKKIIWGIIVVVVIAVGTYAYMYFSTSEYDYDRNHDRALLAETAEWKTYVDDKFGFQLKYPVDLSYRINDGNQPIRTIYFTNSNSIYGLVMNIIPIKNSSTTTDENLSAKLSLDDLLRDRYIRFYPNSTWATTTVDSIITMKGTVIDEKNVKNTAMFFIKDDYLYEISGNEQSSIVKVFSTLKFTN